MPAKGGSSRGLVQNEHCWLFVLGSFDGIGHG